MAIHRVGGDGDLAVVGQVVADGVLEQVLGQPFEEHRVARDRGGLQVGTDVEAGGVRGAS